MIAAALFRNFNHGQAGVPRSADLATLFLAAGASAARPVRGNGTVVLAADDPAEVAARVRDAVARDATWSDVVLVRPDDWLHDLATRLDGCAPTTEVTLYDADCFPHPTPWRPATGRLTVVHADGGHAVCVNDEPRTSFGTRALERLLGVPATSRSADTMVRVARAAHDLAAMHDDGPR